MSLPTNKQPPSGRAISVAKRVAKSGGGAAGGLSPDVGLMFRHLERGGGERFAVGSGPASANALRKHLLQALGDARRLQDQFLGTTQ
jgi:hypothetical protein